MNGGDLWRFPAGRWQKSTMMMDVYGGAWIGIHCEILKHFTILVGGFNPFEKY